MDAEVCCTEAFLTIAQLIPFNSKKTRRHTTVEYWVTSDHGPHTLSHEPPLPLYVGFEKASLPPTYTVVHALAVHISESTVPAPPASKVQLSDNLDKAVTEETKWTEKVSALLGKASLTLKDAVSRATHRAAQNRARTEVEVISAMLTLFAEKSDSPAMVKHAM
ncbi:hypothetical protein LSAT2_021159 [Lamellibrachia satsuma]|nr:hypothetical protein LSAT2_021159 [Lamellibrachia satsuma]